MSTVDEIERAIEQLSPTEVEELAAWLEARRVRRLTGAELEGWLQRAKGAAIPGISTAAILAMTRGEE